VTALQRICDTKRGGVLINDEKVRLGKEVFVTYYKILS
jgi:hypothetical protein